MSDYRRGSGRTRLRIGGSMTPQGADRAGLLLALAANITGGLLGLAALVFAVSRVL